MVDLGLVVDVGLLMSYCLLGVLDLMAYFLALEELVKPCVRWFFMVVLSSALSGLGRVSFGWTLLGFGGFFICVLSSWNWSNKSNSRDARGVRD